jgi:hypothetical protein
MSKPIWIMEDLKRGEWYVDQPYRLYKSKESAEAGLERMRKLVGTRIPRRVTKFCAVEGEK